ncbi:MAG: hypothetical protein KGI54_18800 [Pseudomonadota bacterium]|nr:hypothetical protein [Pseudomonadota bacterium]
MIPFLLIAGIGIGRVWKNTNAIQSQGDQFHHIVVRKAEQDITMLREALMAFMGATTENELHEMEIVLRQLPAPEKDNE